MTILSVRTSLTRASVAVAAVLAVGLTVTQPALAGTNGGTWTRNSTVSDAVANNGNGTWTYSYTVNNTSTVEPLTPATPEPWIVDWELPWFGDAGITNIMSPHNWAYAIEDIGTPNQSTGWGGEAAWQDPNDPFYAGAGSPFTTVSKVLHWYNLCWTQGNQLAGGLSLSAVAACESTLQDAISPGGSLDGFSFIAAFDETAAPYQASWAALPIRTGDPAFPLGGGFPNSPGAGGTTAVPEPGALGLLGAGLLALLLGRRRRV